MVIVGFLYTDRKDKLLEYKALFCPSFEVTQDVQGLVWPVFTG